jgi:hypothetical protein
MAFDVLSALGIRQQPRSQPPAPQQSNRLPDAPPPRRRGGAAPRRRGISGLADMVNEAYGLMIPATGALAERQAMIENEVDEAMPRQPTRLGDRILRELSMAASPYIDTAMAMSDAPEAGRIAPGRRGDFLRRAYENYTPTEGYYALPRQYGGDADPKMFTNMNYSQSQIDDARRKFMRTHKWARNKKNAADVDVAVRYLLEKGHQGYV